MSNEETVSIEDIERLRETLNRGLVTFKQGLREGLESLKKKTGADMMTCYFYNSYADRCWSFHREGDFRYLHQLFGPVTHIPQREEIFEGFSEQVKVFENVQENPRLTRSILNADSFAKREEVNSIIRIGIDGNEGDRTKVVIFLSFRAPIENADNAKQIAYEFVDNYQKELNKQSKFAELSQSCSWKLRNSQQRLLRLLGEVAGADKDTWHRYFNGAIEDIKDIIEPANGEILICQIYSVEKSGELKVIAGDKNDKVEGETDNEEKQGVIDFVARVAQMYCIENIEAYTAQNPLLFNERRMPRYLPCSTNLKAKSEIAIPMVIGPKVVGVINLECSEKDGFSDENKLALTALASSLSVALQEFHHWNDFRIYSELTTSLIAQENCLTIFERGLEAIKQMGYSYVGIWKFSKSEWVNGSSSGSDVIRLGGLTQWVYDHGKPLLVKDYHLKEGKPQYEILVGTVDESVSSIKWEEADKDTLPPPSYELQSIIEESPTGALCDIGIPVMCDDRDGNQEIFAVLWVKCFRHEVAMLREDYWVLALTCRRMAELKLQYLEVVEAQNLLKKSQFRRHFGKDRTDSILEEIKRNPDFLAAKEASDVIVTNFDARGSTTVTQEFLKNGEGAVLRKFINRYHEMARNELLDFGGVFDKSMGDGIMGIFNIFNEDLLSVEPFDQTKEAMVRAAGSAWTILTKFERIADELHRGRVAFDREAFKLCGAIVLDPNKCFVGNIVENERTGFDYTVYGNAANSAGKLVGMARGSEIGNAIKGEGLLLRVTGMDQDEEIVRQKVQESERKALQEWLEADTSPLLLASAHFDWVIAKFPEVFEGYLMDLPNFGRILLIKKKEGIDLAHLQALHQRTVLPQPQDLEQQ